MRILGIDPGTYKTGAGMIEVLGNQYKLLAVEVIEPVKTGVLPRRLQFIHQELVQFINHYKPDVLALENVFFGKDVKAMVKIGEARACAMLAASQAGTDVVEYPPARVKQSVTGNGRATKQQIQHMIQRLLGLKELPPQDGADALAVAICHFHSRSQLRIPKQLKKSKAVSIG